MTSSKRFLQQTRSRCDPPCNFVDVECHVSRLKHSPVRIVNGFLHPPRSNQERNVNRTRLQPNVWNDRHSSARMCKEDRIPVAITVVRVHDPNEPSYPLVVVLDPCMPFTPSSTSSASLLCRADRRARVPFPYYTAYVERPTIAFQTVSWVPLLTWDSLRERYATGAPQWPFRWQMGREALILFDSV